MNEFSNETVIVTGSTRGIGRSIANSFASRGAKVVVTARNSGEVNRVADEITTSGGQAFAFPADIRVKAQVQTLVDRVIQEFKRVDILVNNAGIIRPASVLDMTESEWDETFAVNAKGAFLCSQAVARIFVSQRSGKIINIASTAGKMPFWNYVAYCSSKAALMQMTKVLALELARFGISVNAVAPGTTADTEMHREALVQGRMTERDFVRGDPEKWRIGIPLGKMAKPETVFNRFSFLPRTRQITLPVKRSLLTGANRFFEAFMTYTRLVSEWTA